MVLLVHSYRSARFDDVFLLVHSYRIARFDDMVLLVNSYRIPRFDDMVLLVHSYTEVPGLMAWSFWFTTTLQKCQV